MMSNVRRNCCVLRFHEIATVSHGLDEQKNPVKQQRHHDEKDSLFSGKCWAARRSGEVWQDQAKHCQCHDDVQIGINALEIEILLAIAQPTDYQAQANKSIEGDHDDSKNGIAADRGVLVAV